MRRFAPTTAAALVVLAACSNGAAAATPKAGTFKGVTSQKDVHLTLEVSKRQGKARVAGASLTFWMNCEDGSTIARTASLGEARVARSGRFLVRGASGGSYGPDRKISVRVAMRGRFTTPSSAQGTFRASATITASPISPAVSCFSGDVGWVGSR
jgi:hypothetical protein